MPADPLGWLVTAARRRYIDLVRSDHRRREREAREALLALPLTGAESSAVDDSLLLLQLCCHPALPRSAQVALTLRAVAGLSTAQIANVYQLPEATVAQRITRAKRRIAELGGALPRPASWPRRWCTVRNSPSPTLTNWPSSTRACPGWRRCARTCSSGRAGTPRRSRPIGRPSSRPGTSPSGCICIPDCDAC